MRQPKIKTHHIKLPREIDCPCRTTFISTDGIILLPLRCVPTRCRWDIRGRIKEIVKDLKAAEEIVQYLETEFKGLLTPYRITGELTGKEQGISGKNPRCAGNLRATGQKKKP